MLVWYDDNIIAFLTAGFRKKSSIIYCTHLYVLERDKSKFTYIHVYIYIAIYMYVLDGVGLYIYKHADVRSKIAG
jgi:hypothetical protein